MSFNKFHEMETASSKSYVIDFEKFHRQLNESASFERSKWKLAKKIRNKKGTSTNIECLRNYSMIS